MNQSTEAVQCIITRKTWFELNKKKKIKVCAGDTELAKRHVHSPNAYHSEASHFLYFAIAGQSLLITVTGPWRALRDSIYVRACLSGSSVIK